MSWPWLLKFHWTCSGIGVGERAVAVLDQRAQVVGRADERGAVAGLEIARAAVAVDPEVAALAVGDQLRRPADAPALADRVGLVPLTTTSAVPLIVLATTLPPGRVAWIWTVQG